MDPALRDKHINMHRVPHTCVYRGAGNPELRTLGVQAGRKEGPEDDMLLALKLEEGATAEQRRRPPEAGKGKDVIFPRAPRRSAALTTP